MLSPIPTTGVIPVSVLSHSLPYHGQRAIDKVHPAFLGAVMINVTLSARRSGNDAFNASCGCARLPVLQAAACREVRLPLVPIRPCISHLKGSALPYTTHVPRGKQPFHVRKSFLISYKALHRGSARNALVCNVVLVVPLDCRQIVNVIDEHTGGLREPVLRDVASPVYALQACSVAQMKAGNRVMREAIILGSIRDLYAL